MTSFPQIDAVYETHLPVRDLDRAVEFYRDTLGLELAYRQEARGMAFFWIGGQQTGMLGLWQAGSAPMRMVLHMAFRLGQEAVLAVPAALKAKAAELLGFEGEPVREPVVSAGCPRSPSIARIPTGIPSSFSAPCPMRLTLTLASAPGHAGFKGDRGSSRSWATDPGRYRAFPATGPTSAVP